MLRGTGVSAEQVIALVRDFRTAGLPPEEVAMLAYAVKLTESPDDITEADVADLRAHDFSDAEILDIAAAAANRNWFSRMMDGLGAEPDAAYLDMEPQLREALTVGHPFPG